MGGVLCLGCILRKENPAPQARKSMRVQPAARKRVQAQPAPRGVYHFPEMELEI